MKRFLNLFHKHIWIRLYSDRTRGMVEQCTNCHEFQTTMIDHSTRKEVVIPGNLLVASASYPVYILCKNREEFMEASKVLLGYFQAKRKNDVRFLYSMDQLRGIRNPIVYLYGTWYENDLCQEPEFTHILNGWN